MVMGKEINDWDIATSALPAQTEEILSEYRIIETGLKHGTVTVLAESTPVEITTYRIESGYSDNRHPDSVEFTDKIEDDLSRRDFTVNAIAYSPFAGTVDPFGGQEDIEAKIIKCVGNPDTRFNEDALRILRALRFSSVLGFEIEEKPAASMLRNRALLANISAERIFVEFSKLLCGKNAASVLEKFSEIIFFLFPELKDMKGCSQNHERHIFDVWEHSLKAVECIEPKAHLRFAALFHDCGKPAVKFSCEKGIDHFYSHAKKSAEAADAVLRRLKTSNKFRTQVVTLVERHDFLPDKLSVKTYKKYFAAYGEETLRDLFKVREADISAQNPAFLAEGLAANKTGLKILEGIINENACLSIKDLKISGNDLIASGISPSPEMGSILNKLLDDVMENKLKNERRDLIERASELVASGRKEPQ